MSKSEQKIKLLEQRIVHLENTVMRLLAVNEEQADINEAQEQVNERIMRECNNITKNVDRIYGRDQEIGNNFQSLCDGYNERYLAIDDRMDLIEEILEVEA